MSLAAELRPDSLGELERSHRHHSRNRGREPTSKGKGGKRRGKMKRGAEGREKLTINIFSLFNFWPKTPNAFGSARTRWGSLSVAPDPLAAIG